MRRAARMYKELGSLAATHHQFWSGYDRIVAKPSSGSFTEDDQALAVALPYRRASR